MVNRKRDPWWNRKASSTTAALVSRRARVAIGQPRLSTSITHTSTESQSLPSPVLEQVATSKFVIAQSANTEDAYQSLPRCTGETADSSACEVVADKDSQQSGIEVESGDVTPTRDEIPIWQCADAKESDGNGKVLYDPLYPTTSIAPISLPKSDSTHNGYATSENGDAYNINNHSNQTISDTTTILGLKECSAPISTKKLYTAEMEARCGSVASNTNLSVESNGVGRLESEANSESIGSSSKRSESGKTSERNRSGDLRRSTNVGDSRKSTDVGELRKSTAVGGSRKSTVVGDSRKSTDVGGSRKSTDVGDSRKSTDVKAHGDKMLERKCSAETTSNRLSTVKTDDAKRKERTCSVTSPNLAATIVRAKKHSSESNRSSLDKPGNDWREQSQSTGSATSNRSTTRERSCSVKRSVSDSKDRRSSRSESRSKISRSRSRSCERKRDDHSRKPRKLNVAYDELRVKYGRALPVRTYSPLNPPPRWIPLPVVHDEKGNKLFGERSVLNHKNDLKSKKSSSENSINNGQEKHSSHSSHNHHHSSRSSKSSERSTESSTNKHGHRSSMSRDRSFNTHKNNKSLSSGVKSFSNSAPSNRVNTGAGSRDKGIGNNAGRLNRSKSVYSSHIRRNVATKKSHLDVDVSGNGRMKMNAGDGVGLQKIRANQKKMFMSTCVEEYYYKTDGSLAEGLKPVLAFKVGNPQFVSEFYEKKTELNDLPVVDHVTTTRIMKEKFAFKIKIGMDQLDKFITDGITVRGQNRFFSQYRQTKFSKASAKNSVLLYRYADVCLGWTKSKTIRKETPLFLLIHKVVYGRTRTYRRLSEAQFIKPAYDCDCLKSIMHKEAVRDSDMRCGLSCCKVVIADFIKGEGFRDRPRQVLPYAFVLYVKDGMSEDEEADMKQTVLVWKKKFEMARWNDLAVRNMLHRHKQIAIQQQAAQQLVHRPISLPMHIPPPDVPTDTLQPWRRPLLGGDTLPQQARMGVNFEPLGIGPLHNDSAPNAGICKRSLSSTSMQSNDMPSPSLKRSRQGPAYQKEIDRLAYEAVTSQQVVAASNSVSFSGMASVMGPAVTPLAAPNIVQTKEIGIQVKTHPTIISLQKKSVSLSASTQTPDLEMDDSYEAMLLRGGPLLPPSTKLCKKCNDKIEDGDGQERTSEKNVAIKVKLFVNQNGRPRQFSSLSSRFSAANDDERDEDQMASEQSRGSKSKTAHVKPTVRGNDHASEAPQPAKGLKLTTDTLKLLCYPDRPHAQQE